MNESIRAQRVLVVDDEQNIADVVAMALRYQGFDVDTAGDGAGALAAVDSFRPDLIVLDIMLPDVEGFEVARRLRGNRNDVPIVFLTARDAGEDKLRGDCDDCWLQTRHGDPKPKRLQYSQTVLLNFAGLSWPHITVATLTKA